MPGVNFTNILHKAFMLKDPKSVKNTVKRSVFFALLGSARKTMSKMLVKLTPRCNMTFTDAFSVDILKVIFLVDQSKINTLKIQMTLI